MVHLATIPITGTGINPARSLGAAVIYNNDKAWDDQVINQTYQWLIFVSLFIKDCYWCFLFPLVSVDFLGWTLHWRSHCRLLPPVHLASGRRQSSWLIQEPNPRLIFNLNSGLLHGFSGLKRVEEGLDEWTMRELLVLLYGGEFLICVDKKSLFVINGRFFFFLNIHVVLSSTLGLALEFTSMLSFLLVSMWLCFERKI